MVRLSQLIHDKVVALDPVYILSLVDVARGTRDHPGVFLPGLLVEGVVPIVVGEFVQKYVKGEGLDMEIERPA